MTEKIGYSAENFNTIQQLQVENAQQTAIRQQEINQTQAAEIESENIEINNQNLQTNSNNVAQTEVNTSAQIVSIPFTSSEQANETVNRTLEQISQNPNAAELVQANQSAQQILGL